MPSKRIHAKRNAADVEPQGTRYLEPHKQTALSILEQPGQALDVQTRAILEPRFGHNFADVRVHADAAAARAADDFGARAFAVGQDIVMNAGEYNPRSAAGLELLTHELTHTIQQRGASRDQPLSVTSRSSSPEVEARETRDHVMGGGTAPKISSGASLSVAQEDDPRWGAAAPVIDPLTNDALGLAPALVAATGSASDAALASVYAADDIAALKAAGITAGAGVGGMSRASAALAPFSGIADTVGRVAAPFSMVGGALDIGQDIGRLVNGDGSAVQNTGNLIAHGASTFSAGVTTLGLAGEGLGVAGLGGEGLTALAGAGGLGPAAAMAGSLAGGYALGTTLGTALYDHTDIGDYASDYIGMTGEIFGGGDRNWLGDQTDSFDQNVSQGKYGSAAIDGLQIGGTALLGTLGGAAAWAGSGIADGAQSLWDLF